MKNIFDSIEYTTWTSYLLVRSLEVIWFVMLIFYRNILVGRDLSEVKLGDFGMVRE